MTTQPQEILIPFVPLIPCSQQLLKIESRYYLKLLSICWSKILCQCIIFCGDYFHCLLLACVCLLIFNEVRSVMLLCMLPDSELSQMNLFLNHLEVVDQERLLVDRVLHLSRRGGVHRGTKYKSPPTSFLQDPSGFQFNPCPVTGNTNFFQSLRSMYLYLSHPLQYIYHTATKVILLKQI